MPSHMMKPQSKCVGAECEGCSSPRCMSKGGVATQTVASNRRDQKGVHESISKSDAGTSNAGSYIGGHGYGNNSEVAKNMHREKLSEMKSMKKPNLYAEGGCVGSSCRGCASANCMAEGGTVHTKGVHSGFGYNEQGVSPVGADVRALNHVKKDPQKWSPNPGYFKDEAVSKHGRVLKELKDMKGKDRTNLAEGGEVEMDDDSEIHSMLGDELMDAFERKDRKGIMDGLEALVMSCMSKGDES